MHCNLGDIYLGVGDLKKAKFHLKAAAMAGNEVSRKNLGIGIMESKSGNM
jgi:TPR repeat protein